MFKTKKRPDNWWTKFQNSGHSFYTVQRVYQDIYCITFPFALLCCHRICNGPLNIANKMFFIIRTFLCQLFGFYFSGTVTIKSSFVIWCKFCKSSKSSKRLLRWRSLLLCVSPEAVKIGGTKLAFIARIVMLRILGLQGKKFLSVVIKDVLFQVLLWHPSFFFGCKKECSDI